jgi:hypothetical protein
VRTPFSLRGWPPLRASARRAERPRASAAPSTCLAARRTDTARGCVGPTSAISRLRTSTRASWVPRLGHGLSLAPRGGNRLVHASEIRFGGPHPPVSPSSREALSSSRDVCGRASDISVAAASSGPASLTRLVPSVSMPPRPPPARPREAVRVGERSEISSMQQGPLPRGALSSARLRSSPAPRLGHRDANHRRLCDRFLPLWGPVPTLAPVHPSRCHRVRASLSLGDACRLLQPGYDARAHPNEPKALARQWSSRPAVTPAPTDAGCVGPSVSFAHLLACEP